MKKQVLSIVSVLLVILGLLTSCGPTTVTSTVPTSTKPASIAPTGTPAKTTPSAENPQYGGVATILVNSDPAGFDEGFTQHSLMPTTHLTNEELLTGDWAKGLAGTGDFSFILACNFKESKGTSVAESWEIVGPGHLVFKIRQGIRYALNPSSEASRLVNGRQLTLDDVVFSYNRCFTLSTAYLRRSNPEVCASVKITTPDKWTMDIQMPPERYADFASFPDSIVIIPPEVVQKYGDMRDWRVSVGSGPFMMTDFVSSSSITFARNPNYWGKDPVGLGKGNQLPYLDGVKILVIADASTRLAAFRTGKADKSDSLLIEDARQFMSPSSPLKQVRYLTDTVYVISMRVDKPELPFKDVRVRRALMMAVDFNAIMKDFYAGDAELLGWPITNQKELKAAYLSIQEAPPSVQELWRYNPDKAKTLLAEAGYPNGFKTKVTCEQAYVDYLSIIKAMWAKVGVDLAIDPLETGVFTSMRTAKTHEQMIYHGKGNSFIWYKMFNIHPSGPNSLSMMNDPVVNQARDEVYKYFAMGDEAKVNQIHKELMKYVLDQAWVIPTPDTYVYTFWWPWLKNHHGETSVGWDNGPSWTKWAWVDMAMKRSMGY